MKIIVPIIEFYDSLFENELSDLIKASFNDKERLLFAKISKGSVITDKHAATLLYDGNPSGQAYSKMKQAFIDKLLRVIINFENNKGSKRRKKVIDLYRDYHAYQIMLVSSMKETALILGKKLLIQADRLGQYHIGYGIARTLASDAWIFAKNASEGEKYWKKFEEHKKYYENNSAILRMYSELMLMAKKKHYNTELSQKAEEYAQQVQPLLDRNNAMSMQFYYQINYAKYAAISEYRGVIENNLEALEYFENFRYRHVSAIDLLKVQLVIAYLGIGEYEKAAEFLSVSIDELGDEKWLNKMSLRIRINLNLQKYNESDTLIEEVLNSIRFKQSEPIFQEKVWIYKYYNDLVQYFTSGTVVNTRKIRNNLTRISTDKKGDNVPLLIADLIYKIQKSGVKSIYDEVDMIKNYIKHNLKKSNNRRSVLFLKFLISLPDSIYNKEKFADTVNNIKSAFEENPAALSIKPDNEIIPYEELMQTLLAAYTKGQTNSQNSASELGSRASDS